MLKYNTSNIGSPGTICHHLPIGRHVLSEFISAVRVRSTNLAFVVVSRLLVLPVYYSSLRFGTALQESAAVLHAIDGFIQERRLPI